MQDPLSSKSLSTQSINEWQRIVRETYQNAESREGEGRYRQRNNIPSRDRSFIFYCKLIRAYQVFMFNVYWGRTRSYWGQTRSCWGRTRPPSLKSRGRTRTVRTGLGAKPPVSSRRSQYWQYSYSHFTLRKPGNQEKLWHM